MSLGVDVARRVGRARKSEQPASCSIAAPTITTRTQICPE